MTREDLYDAAFRYKKTGLWRKMWDTEMFALKLSDGRIGYINVMGRNGEFCGLSIYIGDEGFATLREIMDCSYTGLSEFQEHEKLLQQKCLQLSLDTKDCLQEAELAEVREYAKRHGISFAGKNAFPQFLKYEPNYHPWIVREPEDIAALYEALECASLLADMLKKESLADLGILPFTEQTTEIPMFSLKNGKLNKERFTAVPAAVKKTYPDVILKDESPVELAKSLPRKGVWEAELVRMLEAVQDEPEETPYYPVVLMMVDRADGYMLPISMTIDGDTRPDGILLALIDSALEHDLFPKEIYCRDERTYALLRDLCKKVGTKIRIADKPLRVLDETQIEFCERTKMGNQANMDELMPVIDEILAMDKKDLQDMPERLVEMMRITAVSGFLPEGVGERLWNKLEGL